MRCVHAYVGRLAAVVLDTRRHRALVCGKLGQPVHAREGVAHVPGMPGHEGLVLIVHEGRRKHLLRCRDYKWVL